MIPMPASDRRVARHALYDDIRDGIVTWRFQPGQRLSEEQLAEEFDMSRTPVREALQRLETEQLVERHQNGSLAVTWVSEEELVNLFAVRIALEQVAAVEACRRGTEEDFAAMRQALKAMEIAFRTDSPDLLAQYGREFHAGYISISGNHVCQRMLSQLQPHIDRYRSLTTSVDRRRSEDAINDHKLLLGALKQRDESRSRQLVEAHLTAGKDAALAALHYRLEKSKT